MNALDKQRHLFSKMYPYVFRLHLHVSNLYTPRVSTDALHEIRTQGLYDFFEPRFRSRLCFGNLQVSI